MSRPDASASAALDHQIIRPAFFVYLDIIGDPLRACTAGRSFDFSGTGDPDLDGFTFDGISPTFVDIGSINQKDGGADSVTATLSGLVGIDSALLDVIGNSSNWQGRTARLWRMIRDEYGTQQGALQHYYTGWMTALAIGGDATSQTIQMTIESYLAAYTQASNRTYLDQEAFDPGDMSAKATIAIANGVTGSPLTSTTGTPGTGGGGGVTTACPIEGTPILLANAEHTGPGEEMAAGEIERRLNAGEDIWVWTRHELTGMWGAHRVIGARRVHAPVVLARAASLPQALPWLPVRDLRATRDHPVAPPHWAPWTLLGRLGRRAGKAWVVALTVEGASTYVAAGVLSHNKMSQAMR